jgi:ssDNA-binding Zn-finger/Zn-ribbon topoisomerase 1
MRLALGKRSSIAGAGQPVSCIVCFKRTIDAWVDALLSRLLRLLLPAKEAPEGNAGQVPRYIDEKRAKAIRQAALFAETNGARGAPQCPRCGAEMTLEMAPSGSRFWGCTSYPACKATRKA